MAENDWAIVIGINAYDFLPADDHLKYAVNDAVKVRQFLCEHAKFPQENVLLCCDSAPGASPQQRPTRTGLRHLLKNEIQGAKGVNNFWFFYAGHGIVHDHQDFLLPCDGNPRDLRDTAIPISFVTDCLRDCGAEHVVLVMDMCRNRTRGADEGSRGIGEVMGEQTQQIAKAQGIVTLFSCSRGQRSYEIGDLGQGAFTYALLEGLQQGTTPRALEQYLTNQLPALNRQYGKPIQTPMVIPEPGFKYDRPLLLSCATSADVQQLAVEARDAELEQDYEQAQALWWQVIEADRSTPSDRVKARKAIDRINHKIHQKPEADKHRRAGEEHKKAAERQREREKQQELEQERQEQLKQEAAAKQQQAEDQEAQQQKAEGYRKVLATLISDLEVLRHYSQVLSLNSSAQDIDKFVKRVQSQSFSVAVVGEFMRGKTTLINALLGQDILPTDILPCTRIQYRVTYGATSRARVVYRNGHEEEIDIDQLAEYITNLTSESEATAAQVREVIIYYPISYCQNNVYIIDTPGLHNEDRMTEITLQLLPFVDAIIMVVMVPVLFSEFEKTFLVTKLLTTIDLARIIFVVNGVDRSKNSEEPHKSIQLIQYHIRKFILQRAKDQYGENSPEYEAYAKKIGTPRVYALSASQALQAKQTGNGELLTESHFPEFEVAFKQFLDHERGSAVLQMIINYLIASATKILSTLNLQQDALALQKEEFQIAYEQSLAEIKTLQNRTAEEMKRLNVAAEYVQCNVQPLILELESTLKQSAQEVINLVEITPGELQNKQALIEKLGEQVSEAVKKVSQKQVEKILHKINQDFLERLYVQEYARSINTSFVLSIDADLVLQGIEMQFLSINLENQGKRNERIEKFKVSYQQAVFIKIENHFRENRIDRKFNEQISDILTNLKQELSQELHAVLDNTQNTRKEVHAKHEQDAVMIEQEQRDLNQISAETQQILGNAQRLLEPLLEQVNV